MIVRGVVIEAPAESLKKVPPTANQLDVLATLRIRKHVEPEAFKFANLLILEVEGFSTAYEASVLIGWWTNADIGAKTKLLIEVANVSKIQKMAGVQVDGAVPCRRFEPEPPQQFEDLSKFGWTACDCRDPQCDAMIAKCRGGRVQIQPTPGGWMRCVAYPFDQKARVGDLTKDFDCAYRLAAKEIERLGGQL